MNSKKTARAHRYRRARAKIRELRMARLSVQRSPQHIYAQVIMPDGRVVAAASTVEKDHKAYGGNVAAAKLIGARVAERAKGAGIEKVAFDRSGFKYHGRIKALADAAREVGLIF